jgi:phosphatidylserine/phosphatidylglycerophosphate/cardiolipin synthase-like enzyme
VADAVSAAIGVGVGPAVARLVPDIAYREELGRLVMAARERVWCSIFLVELDPHADPELRVPSALRELASARWRGVDVRLLVGGSRSNLLIAEASAGAVALARQLGIPVRGLGRAGRRGSHVKLVIADDWVLTGSHNWSPGALGGQTQDSVAVRSAGLSAYLAGTFLDQWRRAAR